MGFEQGEEGARLALPGDIWWYEEEGLPIA